MNKPIWISVPFSTIEEGLAEYDLLKQYPIAENKGYREIYKCCYVSLHVASKEKCYSMNIFDNRKELVLPSFKYLEEALLLLNLGIPVKDIKDIFSSIPK